MAYIGKQPTPVPLTSEDIADGIITNTDIAADAAIAQTKLAALSIATANIEDDAITAAKINDGEIVNAAVSATAAIDDTKIAPPYYAAVANFPAASDHHGRVVHAHSEEAMFYSHGGSWVQLADNSDIPTNTSDLTNDSSFAVLSADQTFTGGNRGTVTVANTASFDMDTTNNFSCTPTANYTITFTNITAGQSGNIYINNATNYTASKAASVKLGSADLTTLSATGEYWLSYFAPSASVVLVSVTAALS